MSYDESIDLGTHLDRNKNDIKRWKNEGKTIKQITTEVLTNFWDDDTSPEGIKWCKIRDAFISVGKGSVVTQINYLCAATTNGEIVECHQTQYTLHTQRPEAFTQRNPASSLQTPCHSNSCGRVLGQVGLNCGTENLHQSTISNSSAAPNTKETQIRLSGTPGKFQKKKK